MADNGKAPRARKPTLPPPPVVGSGPLKQAKPPKVNGARSKDSEISATKLQRQLLEDEPSGPKITTPSRGGVSGAQPQARPTSTPKRAPEPPPRAEALPKPPPRPAPRPAAAPKRGPKGVPKPLVASRSASRGKSKAPKPASKSRNETRPMGPEGLKDQTLSRVRLTDGGQDPNSIDADSTGVQVLEQVRLEPGELVVGTRYRIVGWLGEGGMGVVYECEHVDIERRVALKVLRTGVDPNSRRAKMFREEARAVSRAGRNEEGQVSNIVEIYDFGELPDGRMWFAMELLHGRSMARLLHEGPMDAAWLIGVLRQLCKGLAAAHDAGVVHRDIKPGNIMVVRDRGREDVVKVVDFGVAAVLAEGDSAEVQLEGTPNYMAPEQATGSAFDHRLDIYAVGAVAFHMLVGSPPFFGDDVFQLLRRVCTEPPPRPSEVNPEVDIPVPLEEVLLRCLAKEPDGRYDDMRELEAALCEAQIAAKLVTPWDDLPLPRVEPLARYEALVRNMPKPAVTAGRSGRTWAFLAAAAVAVGLAGWGIIAAQSDDAVAEVDDRIAEHVAAARGAAARAVYLYPPPDAPDTRTAYLEVVDLEKLSKELGDSATEAGAELRHEFADTLERLGDRYWDRKGGRPFAVDYYIQALVFDPTRDRIRERAPITPGQLTELQRKGGTLDFEAAELSASEPLLALAEDDEQERVRKLEEIGNKEDEHGLQTELRIQKLLEDEEAAGVKVASRPKRSPRRPESSPSGDGGGAPKDFEEPKDGGADVAAAREVKRSNELVLQGLSALRSGKRQRAETLFHRALDQDHRSHRALDGLSQVHFARGNYQQAVSYGKRAVKLAGRRGSYRINLGDAYFKVFRYQEAKTEYRKAKDLGHRDARARLEKVKAKLGQ